jgi:hypothetical protein
MLLAFGWMHKVTVKINAFYKQIDGSVKKGKDIPALN